MNQNIETFFFVLYYIKFGKFNYSRFYSAFVKILFCFLNMIVFFFVRILYTAIKISGFRESEYSETSLYRTNFTAEISLQRTFFLGKDEMKVKLSKQNLQCSRHFISDTIFKSQFALLYTFYFKQCFTVSLSFLRSLPFYFLASLMAF